MLILTRKLGETIHIGDTISVTVVEIDRGKIRLGIAAPGDVPIYRQELLGTVAETNLAARAQAGQETR